MEAQVNQVALELYLMIVKVAGAIAGLRLGVAGLRAMAGDQDSLPLAIRQVALGLVVIICSQTIVAIVQRFAEGLAIYRQGW